MWMTVDKYLVLGFRTKYYRNPFTCAFLQAIPNTNLQNHELTRNGIVWLKAWLNVEHNKDDARPFCMELVDILMWHSRRKVGGKD